MHTCRLQTFDPVFDFSLRNHSGIQGESTVRVTAQTGFETLNADRIS